MESEVTDLEIFLYENRVIDYDEAALHGFKQCWEFTKRVTRFTEEELLLHLDSYTVSKRIKEGLEKLENEVKEMQEDERKRTETDI